MCNLTNCPQSTPPDLGILLHIHTVPIGLCCSIVYQKNKVSSGSAHASTVLLLLHNLLIMPLYQLTKKAVSRQHAIWKHTSWGLTAIPLVTRKSLCLQWKDTARTGEPMKGLTSNSFISHPSFSVGNSWQIMAVSSQYALWFCLCAWNVSCLNCADHKKRQSIYPKYP